MKKGKDLIGLPVISLANGETVGRVRDVLFDPHSNYLQGIVMDAGSWLKGLRKIDFEDFVAVGKDAITIANEDVIVKTDSDAECIIESEGTVIGNRVMTKDGNELGTIADIVFEHTTGQITHYQLSDGIIQDVLAGRETIPVDTEFIYGKDAIIVNLHRE